MVVVQNIPNEVADFHCCVPDESKHFALMHISPQGL